MNNKIEKIIKPAFSIIFLFIVYGCAATRLENIREYRLDLSPDSTAQFLTIVMTSGVNLDEDEKYRIYHANLSHAEDTISILKDGNDYTSHRKFKKISQVRDKEIKKILSRQQYKVYLAGRELYEENLKSFIELVKERRKEEEDLKPLFEDSIYEMNGWIDK